MFHPKGPTFFELARQCLSSTERGYDLLAEKFDYTPFRTPDVILATAASEIGQFAPIGSALDVCCGTGAAMQSIAPMCSKRLVGIDMSEGMLEVARQNTAELATNVKVEFVRGSVLDMPFQEQFDLVVSFGAFGHILPADEPLFVQQIKQALKVGGKFVFVTTTMPPMTSAVFWMCRGFNAAMHIRNWLFKPPFIMFYLTFLLPEVQALLEQQGFEVQIKQPFGGVLSRLRLIVAKKK